MKLRKNLLRFAWFSKEGGGATIGTQRNGPEEEAGLSTNSLLWDPLELFWAFPINAMTQLKQDPRSLRCWANSPTQEQFAHDNECLWKGCMASKMKITSLYMKEVYVFFNEKWIWIMIVNWYHPLFVIVVTFQISFAAMKPREREGGGGFGRKRSTTNIFSTFR